MSLNDRFHSISTIIRTTTPSISSQGTGFFYQRLAPSDGPGPQWVAVKGQWLVTNRHVLLPPSGGTENEPSSVTFHLRKLNSENQLAWDPITLATADIEKLARFHQNNSIDVAIIDISEIFAGRINSGERVGGYSAVSSGNFAGKNNIEIEASSDVLVIGYPRGFYDNVNLYPVIKSGIVASRWGANFRGNRYFLIDAKLFPGSSGSIVISKPIDIVVKAGQVMHSAEKQFAFLGIYSGEPYQQQHPIELDDMIIIQKSGFNLGNVWYAEVIEEIIDSGVPLSEALTVE
jgi:trypsin-like peptidase